MIKLNLSARNIFVLCILFEHSFYTSAKPLHNSFSGEDPQLNKSVINSCLIQTEINMDTGKKELKVKDCDKNEYNIITIGQQTWMAENLKTTKFNDGTSIPLITDATEWNNLTTPGYTWYNNDTSNVKNTFGALYNWFTVNTGKLCPSGWHVPSDSEWATMVTFLGGEDMAGGKIKESGNIHWKIPNKGGTNESAFTALAGGYRDYAGRYFYLGTYGGWWSSTEYFAGSSWSWYAYYSIDDMIRTISGKSDGYSVRCIQDH